MKTSIRTKFSIGILFFFIIIVVLSVFSAVTLNNLSKKTSAILNENHLSVVYARDMSESLMKINQEITTSFLTNKKPDSLLIHKELNLFDKSLQLEKNNITEAGEEAIASGIETGFIACRDSLVRLNGPSKSSEKLLSLQKEFGKLHQQLVLLSQINERAIELKTDEAKISAKRAFTQMAILGTLCFLIALSFTYSFASYFNERFFQLFNGIREIVSSNFGQRLYFDGKDEFYEISVVFNEMAEKLNENKLKTTSVTLPDLKPGYEANDLQEMRRLLDRMKSIEEQATALISKLENMK
jgi:methyl-accepting chemotaxis protein